MRREALLVTILCLLLGSLGVVRSWSDDGGGIIYPVALDDDRLLPISDYDTPPMYEMEEFAPLLDEQKAYLKSTAGDEKRLLRKGRSASPGSGIGSGSGSGVSDIEGCLLPSDVPSPPTDTEEMLTQRALCDVSCLEEEVDLPPLEELWNTFPLNVLTTDCLSYSRYEACRLACYSRVEDPSINDCPRTCSRELCSGICGSRRSCFSVQFPPCGINCGRRQCERGCDFFDDLSDRELYPQSLNPLTLPPPTRDNLELPLYILDITGAAPSGFTRTDHTVVSVLARVESQPGDYSYYLLDSSLKLNLEAFVCRRVRVSFAVATPFFQLSSYSESATIEVNNTGALLFPDQLDSFNTSFMPDLRAGFFLEHILTVEWERPNGFEVVTDYTVTVDLQSGAGCGISGVETYQPDRNATSLTVYSSATHRFYSQCTYIIRVQVNLLRPGDAVPRVSISPPEYPVPSDSDFQQSCPRQFNNETFLYDVTLSWTLNNTSPAFISAINSFGIFRIDVRGGQTTGITPQGTITAVPGQTEYAESFQYAPISEEGLTYSLTVTILFLQNLTASGLPFISFVCEVDPLPPPRPGTVENVRLTREPLFFKNFVGDERFVTVRMKFEWSLAVVLFGDLIRYEATLRLDVLGPRESPPDLTTTSYLPSATSGSISQTLQTLETNFTLFLQIRAISNLDFGDWSQPLAIQIEKLELYFINNTPRVEGNTITAEFETNRPGVEILCHLTRSAVPVQDCTSSSFVQTNLPPGRYTVRAVARDQATGDRAIVRSSVQVSVDETFCTVHLVNRLVTIRGNNATVEFGSTGIAAEFLCVLDRQRIFECQSPVLLTGLASGRHHFKVIPTNCGRQYRPRVVQFII